MAKTVGVIDDRGAGSVGSGLSGINQKTLAQEILAKNPNRNTIHPFRAYCQRVIKLSGVPDTDETRKMASHVCGEVAKLPFVPDDEINVSPVGTKKTTEFEQQIEKTARRAETAIDSAMVWTASALKLSKAALELRQKAPDGSRGIAWVNDPLPGERQEEPQVPSAFRPEPDLEDNEEEDES